MRLNVFVSEVRSARLGTRTARRRALISPELLNTRFKISEKSNEDSLEHVVWAQGYRLDQASL